MKRIIIFIIGINIVGCSNAGYREVGNSYIKYSKTADGASPFIMPVNPVQDPNLTRTTCPTDVSLAGECLAFLHRQPIEFWEQYQKEAPALRAGYLTCEDLNNQFGDWLSTKSGELRDKDRTWNMINGYLPHSVVEESSYTIHQMATAFMNQEYYQIVNNGARPELCRERIAYWKAQILSITEKFPPLKG